MNFCMQDDKKTQNLREKFSEFYSKYIVQTPDLLDIQNLLSVEQDYFQYYDSAFPKEIGNYDVSYDNDGCLMSKVSDKKFGSVKHSFRYDGLMSCKPIPFKEVAAIMSQDIKKLIKPEACCAAYGVTWEANVEKIAFCSISPDDCSVQIKLFNASIYKKCFETNLPRLISSINKAGDLQKANLSTNEAAMLLNLIKDMGKNDLGKNYDPNSKLGKAIEDAKRNAEEITNTLLPDLKNKLSGNPNQDPLNSLFGYPSDPNSSNGGGRNGTGNNPNNYGGIGNGQNSYKTGSNDKGYNGSNANGPNGSSKNGRNNQAKINNSGPNSTGSNTNSSGNKSGSNSNGQNNKNNLNSKKLSNDFVSYGSPKKNEKPAKLDNSKDAFLRNMFQKDFDKLDKDMKKNPEKFANNKSAFIQPPKTTKEEEAAIEKEKQAKEKLNEKAVALAQTFAEDFKNRYSGQKLSPEDISKISGLIVDNPKAFEQMKKNNVPLDMDMIEKLRSSSSKDAFKMIDTVLKEKNLTINSTSTKGTRCPGNGEDSNSKNSPGAIAADSVPTKQENSDKTALPGDSSTSFNSDDDFNNLNFANDLKHDLNGENAEDDAKKGSNKGGRKIYIIMPMPTKKQNSKINRSMDPSHPPQPPDVLSKIELKQEGDKILLPDGKVVATVQGIPTGIKNSAAGGAAGATGAAGAKGAAGATGANGAAGATGANGANGAAGATGAAGAAGKGPDGLPLKPGVILNIKKPNVKEMLLQNKPANPNDPTLGNALAKDINDKINNASKKFNKEHPEGPYVSKEELAKFKVTLTLVGSWLRMPNEAEAQKSYLSDMLISERVAYDLVMKLQKMNERFTY